jgi:hypothetical protein
MANNNNVTSDDQLAEVEEKVHELCWYVVQNEYAKPDDADLDYVFHPDFIRGLEALHFIEENGYLSRELMEELNELYRKHKKEFDRLGIDKEMDLS